MSEPPSLDDAARLLFKNCPDDVKERGLNSPEIFACLLHQNPYLFKRVKAVVTGNDSDFVHIWESCLREISIRNSPFQREENVSTTLDRIAPNLVRLVHGRTDIPLWTLSECPSEDSRNRVPRFSLHSLIEADTKPSMLFYDLGSFVENPVLKERLQDLFIMGKDTFLVNASATGKTRLLFEGLFQHWGIYATACADQEAQALYFATVRSLVGERKMVQDLPETTALGYQMLLDDNNDCLNRRFSIVLLAHLYIFREFLKISHAKHAIDNDDLRKLWFLGQVWRSSIDTLSLDAHEELLLILEYRHTSFIVEELATVVEEIKFLLPQTIKREGLFIAIDEAKLLMKPAWRDSAGEEHPLLRSLIRTWKHHLAGLDCPVTFIVAGIKIPMEAFPSSSPEWSGWRWTSNTGFFTPDGQRDYILPFFPPSFPETPSGKAFIDRVWKWCGSRHRLTACLIPMLIRDNFKHPHSVLDCYIQRLITYDATDGAEFVKKEGGPVYVWPFFVPADEIIGCDRLAQSAAHEVIFHYITTGIHPPFYGIDRINLVSCGIGQFKDAALQVIAMDQPGLNIAAAIWLGKDKGLHPWEVRSLRLFTPFSKLFNLRWPNGDRYSSAGYLAFYLTHAFVGVRTLDDIFHIPAPLWIGNSSFMAQLVVLRKTERGDIQERTIEPSDLLSNAPPLAYKASSFEDVLAWLRQERVGAFCSCPSGFSADLIFTLKLNRKYFWVVLRAVGQGVSLKAETDSLNQENLFLSRDGNVHEKDFLGALQILPNVLAPPGSFPFLRVLASFPDEPKLPREDLTQSLLGGPVAVLRLDTFKEVTESYSPTDLVEGVIASIHGKRSSYSDASFFSPQPTDG